MGVSIGAHVYDLHSLTAEIKEKRTKNLDVDVREIIEMVARACGAVVGWGESLDVEKVIVVENEYYEDYDPTSAFTGVLSKYFGMGDEYGYYFFRNYDRLPGGVEESEVWNAIGVIDPYEEGYESDDY